MRFAVVANLGSGAAAKLGPAALDELVRSSLGERLATLEIADPGAIAAALDRAFAGDADAVAVIGGDGTCRGAAERAARAARPVVFLPGGTMNLLARRIWGERGLQDALNVLGRGETAPFRLDAAEISGQLFLVAAMFGAAPRLTRMREDLRRTRSLVQFARALREALGNLKGLMRPSILVMEPDGVGGFMPALVVTPGDAAQAFAPSDAAAASTSQATQGLECVAATVKGWPGLAVATLRVLIGANWRKDDRLLAFNAPSVRVGARGRRLRVTLDGELALAPNPATIRFLPGHLAALGPAVEPTAALAV